MEDIARLSKEANLAYYEMVICKYTNTLCKYTERGQIVVVKGEGHLFAPGLVHCAVWSPQHQRGPHEAETGRSLFILYVHPQLDPNFHLCTLVLVPSKYSRSFLTCILNLTLIFILVLSYIQLFTLLPSHVHPLSIRYVCHVHSPLCASSTWP